MDQIPCELQYLILSFVSFSEWFAILCTCKTWKELGEKIFDPSINNNTAIEWSCSFGKIVCVKRLLRDPRIDPSANQSHSLLCASKFGCVETVQLLLKDKRVDPTVNDNLAIRWATDFGHHHVVKELMKDERVDPSACYNYAIRYASVYGYHQIVQELLKDKRVDPSANHNFAIKYASESGHLDVVKILMSDERVDPSDGENYALKSTNDLGVVMELMKDKRVRESLKVEWMCLRDDWDVLKQLVERENVSVEDMKRVLIIANLRGHWQAVRELLRGGMHPDMEKNRVLYLQLVKEMLKSGGSIQQEKLIKRECDAEDLQIAKKLKINEE